MLIENFDTEVPIRFGYVVAALSFLVGAILLLIYDVRLVRKHMQEIKLDSQIIRARLLAVREQTESMTTPIKEARGISRDLEDQARSLRILLGLETPKNTKDGDDA